MLQQQLLVLLVPALIQCLLVPQQLLKAPSFSRQLRLNWSSNADSCACTGSMLSSEPLMICLRQVCRSMHER